MATSTTAPRIGAARWAGVVLAGFLVLSAHAQRVVQPQELEHFKRMSQEQSVPLRPARVPVSQVRVAALADRQAAAADDPYRGAAILYRGLPVTPAYWSFGETVYWALDDAQMAGLPVLFGGGEVTQYQFVWGNHSDFPGDTIQSYVVVSFYNAPPDPVADATDPVVEPPTPVSSVGWLFAPITFPAAGNFTITSPVLDLAAAGLPNFDLDDTFYVEIVPLEWSALTETAVADPDVHAAFVQSAPLIGANQDRFWSDFFVVNPAFAPGDGDGFYDHPSELDLGGAAGFPDYSGFSLWGVPCSGTPSLKLGVRDPDDLCVQPGETVTLTLSMSCLADDVRGFQSFLSFDTGLLSFTGGAYVAPSPFGLPIIDPIVAAGSDLDVASGIDDLHGQSPTTSASDLVTLTFVAGATEGQTQIVFRPHDPPTRFSDAFGSEIVPDTYDSPIITIDATPPAITCPPDITVECTESTDPNHTGAPAVVDNLDPAPAVTFSDAVAPGVCPQAAVITRTWTAVDCAGNVSASCDQTITVTDTHAPAITCPADITVNADAGLCTAAIDPGLATAIDNCDPSPSIGFVRSDGQPNLTDPYDSSGPVTITWTASDACGNSSSCVQTITVNPVNDLVVHVALGAVNEPLLQRCITFELWTCGGPTPLTIEQPMTFTAGAATTTLEVPCGSYDCLTARDRLHTLRRALDPLPISGTQYDADFVAAGKDLIGGDLNDDDVIDVLDYNIFIATFTLDYGNGNTNCSTTAPHADISGDGLVSTADFTFIQVGYLTEGDAGCCTMAPVASSDSPGGRGPAAALPSDSRTPAGAAARPAEDTKPPRQRTNTSGS